MTEPEIVEVRLRMLDLCIPYGVKAKELIPFDEEINKVAELPSQEREKELASIAEKIKVFYNKTVRVAIS